MSTWVSAGIWRTAEPWREAAEAVGLELGRGTPVLEAGEHPWACDLPVSLRCYLAQIGF